MQCAAKRQNPKDRIMSNRKVCMRSEGRKSEMLTGTATVSMGVQQKAVRCDTDRCQPCITHFECIRQAAGGIYDHFEWTCLEVEYDLMS